MDRRQTRLPGRCSHYRRAAFVIATAAVTALVISPVAVAKKGDKPGGKGRMVAVTGQIRSDTPTSIDPTCPRGMKAVGGGYRGFAIVVSGFGVPGGGTAVAEVPVVLESRRLGPRVWHVSAKLVRNPEVAPGFGTAALTASVACKRLKGKVSEVAAAGPTSTASSTPTSARASCRGGQTAVAGGFSATPPPAGEGYVFPSIYESFRMGRRAWRSSAIPGKQPAVAITSYAYCIHEREAPVARVRRRPSGLTSTPDCPKGLRANAGGFRLAPTPGAVFTTSEGPISGGDGWTVSAFSFPSSAGKVTAFGYCS